MIRLASGATLVLAALALAGCGGRGIDPLQPASVALPPTGGDCSATRLKQTVLDTTREWYLFPELLPAAPDPAPFASPSEFLDSLTAQARAQSRDRFFSHVVSIAEENRLLSGSTVGFGITLLERSGPARLFVGQSFAGSAAADAGLARGAEILAIGESAGALRSIGEIVATTGGVTAALGPTTAGITRVLRWRETTGAVVERALTKREFALDAVPAASVRVLTTGDGTRVGYLTLRSFVSDGVGGTELVALRNAFAGFAAQNLRHLIIDLRYNGGGLVSIAEQLLNLIAGDQVGQISYATRLNPRQVSQQETRRFARLAQTLPTLRVAFLVTDRSASASELVINSTVPYVRTAIIGARSFGKPVGQSAFDVSSCDFRLRLVTFRSVNRNGDGDYYTGLPDAAFASAGGSACAAEDELARTPGDPAEAMTATALAWLGSPGPSCPGPVIAATESSTAASASRRSEAGKPSSERIDLPGLHPYLPGTY